MRTSAGAAALWMMTLVALGCSLPAGLGGDSIERSSPLYGLRLVTERPVGSAVHEPSDLAFDPSTGAFWTVSDSDGTVHQIASDGAAMGKPLKTSGVDLEGIALDPKSGNLFVVDEGNSSVIEMTREGELVRTFVLPVRGGNNGIEGIAYDPANDGFVLVKERNPTELIFVNRTGVITSRVGVQTEDLSAVTVSPDGKSIFVVARFEEAVLELDRQGRRRNRLPLNVYAIEGLAFDERGRLFTVADLGSKERGMLYLFVRDGQP